MLSAAARNASLKIGLRFGVLNERLTSARFGHRNNIGRRRVLALHRRSATAVEVAEVGLLRVRALVGAEVLLQRSDKVIFKERVGPVVMYLLDGRSTRFQAGRSLWYVGAQRKVEKLAFALPLEPAMRHCK